MTESTAEAIASADLEQLYEQLGKLLLGDGFGVGGQDPEESSRFGKKWLNSRLDGLRGQLCDKPIVQELTGNLTWDILAVSAYLHEYLKGNQLLAMTVAGIIVRRGLTKFCSVDS